MEEERAHEAAALRDSVLAQLSAPTPEQVQFLHHRYSRRLEWYGARGRLLGVIHATLALIVIGAGLLTSGITALAQGEIGELSPWSFLVIALGVVVGLTTGLTQIWNPGQRSYNYTTAEADLRQEGWEFVHRRGRYAGLAYPQEAWDLFVDTALAIERRASLTALGGGSQPNPT